MFPSASLQRTMTHLRDDLVRSVNPERLCLSHELNMQIANLDSYGKKESSTEKSAMLLMRDGLPWYDGSCVRPGWGKVLTATHVIFAGGIQPLKYEVWAKDEGHSSSGLVNRLDITVPDDRRYSLRDMRDPRANRGGDVAGPSNLQAQPSVQLSTRNAPPETLIPNLVAGLPVPPVHHSAHSPGQTDTQHRRSPAGASQPDGAEDGDSHADVDNGEEEVADEDAAETAADPAANPLKDEFLKEVALLPDSDRQDDDEADLITRVQDLPFMPKVVPCKSYMFWLNSTANSFPSSARIPVRDFSRALATSYILS